MPIPGEAPNRVITLTTAGRAAVEGFLIDPKSTYIPAIESDIAPHVVITADTNPLRTLFSEVEGNTEYTGYENFLFGGTHGRTGDKRVCIETQNTARITQLKLLGSALGSTPTSVVIEKLGAFQRECATEFMTSEKDPKMSNKKMRAWNMTCDLQRELLGFEEEELELLKGGPNSDGYFSRTEKLKEKLIAKIDNQLRIADEDAKEIYSFQSGIYDALTKARSEIERFEFDWTKEYTPVDQLRYTQTDEKPKTLYYQSSFHVSSNNNLYNNMYILYKNLGERYSTTADLIDKGLISDTSLFNLDYRNKSTLKKIYEFVRPSTILSGATSFLKKVGLFGKAVVDASTNGVKQTTSYFSHQAETFSEVHFHNHKKTSTIEQDKVMDELSSSSKLGDDIVIGAELEDAHLVMPNIKHNDILHDNIVSRLFRIGRDMVNEMVDSYIYHPGFTVGAGSAAVGYVAASMNPAIVNKMLHALKINFDSKEFFYSAKLASRSTYAIDVVNFGKANVAAWILDKELKALLGESDDDAPDIDHRDDEISKLICLSLLAGSNSARSFDILSNKASEQRKKYLESLGVNKETTKKIEEIVKKLIKDKRPIVNYKVDAVASFLLLIPRLVMPTIRLLTSPFVGIYNAVVNKDFSEFSRSIIFEARHFKEESKKFARLCVNFTFGAIRIAHTVITAPISILSNFIVTFLAIKPLATIADGFKNIFGYFNKKVTSMNEGFLKNFVTKIISPLYLAWMTFKYAAEKVLKFKHNSKSIFVTINKTIRKTYNRPRFYLNKALRPNESSVSMKELQKLIKKNLNTNDIINIRSATQSLKDSIRETMKTSTTSKESSSSLLTMSRDTHLNREEQDSKNILLRKHEGDDEEPKPEAPHHPPRLSD